MAVCFFQTEVSDNAQTAVNDIDYPQDYCVKVRVCVVLKACCFVFVWISATNAQNNSFDQYVIAVEL